MTPAELLDAVAQLLDEQEGPGGPYRWNDDPPDGWASQQAFREAYRWRAREMLNLILPAVFDQLGDRVLPAYAEIVAGPGVGTLEAWVRETCEQQGVPVQVTDPDTVAYVARLLR